MRPLHVGVKTLELERIHVTDPQYLVLARFDQISQNLGPCVAL